ncbi:helix-turn-helix domain-containing protein [Ligilactobacillus pobuzihii]|nr:helix-turn-helix domain-containing protein [Ligilactobacillus pobuzihii]
MLKLKMMRFNLGLTQREVAEKMGVTEASYNGWENGTRAPHAQNVKKLADFFVR